MAKNSKIPTYTVDMPTSGVIFRKVNKNSDNLYAYYCISSYRNEKGQPTCKRIQIGKKDKTTGRLIPNDNYYSYFNKEPVVPLVIDNPVVKSYGHFVLINKCVRDYNLYNILDAIFDEKCKEILSLAFYMLLEGSTMNGSDIWFEKNYSYLSLPISSQRVSELFSLISLEKRVDFFRLWRGQLHDNEFLSYDVTSLSSYTRNMNIFEYGYNRDDDDLPQINMAMFFGEESKLPIFYNLYNGSINDKSDFAKIMEHTDELDITNVRFIMDRGFYSKPNVSYLLKNSKKFLMAVENRLSFIKHCILENCKTIEGIENRLDGTEFFSIKSECINPKNKDEKFDIYLYYNLERKQSELNAQLRKVKEYEKDLIVLSVNEIETLDELNKSKYANYFKFDIKNKKLVFERDNDKINQEANLFGFFAFISNDSTLTPLTALNTYKKRGDIEQSFDGLKNSIDMKKIKTHKQETTEGKVFVAFISLIIKSMIGKKLVENAVNYNKLSDTEKKSQTNLNYYDPRLLLNELSKIQITNVYSHITILQVLSKKQKTIYKLFDIDEQKIKKECPESI